MVDALIRWCLKHAFLVIIAVGAVLSFSFAARVRSTSATATSFTKGFGISIG